MQAEVACPFSAGGRDLPAAIVNDRHFRGRLPIWRAQAGRGFQNETGGRREPRNDDGRSDAPNGEVRNACYRRDGSTASGKTRVVRRRYGIGRWSRSRRKDHRRHSACIGRASRAGE